MKRCLAFLLIPLAATAAGQAGETTTTTRPQSACLAPGLDLGQPTAPLAPPTSQAYAEKMAKKPAADRRAPSAKPRAEKRADRKEARHAKKAHHKEARAQRKEAKRS